MGGQLRRSCQILNRCGLHLLPPARDDYSHSRIHRAARSCAFHRQDLPPKRRPSQGTARANRPSFPHAMLREKRNARANCPRRHVPIQPRHQCGGKRDSGPAGNAELEFQSARSIDAAGNRPSTNPLVSALCSTICANSVPKRWPSAAHRRRPVEKSNPIMMIPAPRTSRLIPGLFRFADTKCSRLRRSAVHPNLPGTSLHGAQSSLSHPHPESRTVDYLPARRSPAAIGV